MIGRLRARAASVLDGGEGTVERIEKVLSQTRAEIKRSKKLERLIKAAQRRRTPKQKKPLE